MTMLDIKILRVGDAAPMDGIDPSTVIEARVDTAYLIESGMQSGRPSVAFTMTLPDGRIVFAETTLRLLNGLMHAAHGAFPEAFHDDN